MHCLLSNGGSLIGTALGVSAAWGSMRTCIQLLQFSLQPFSCASNVAGGLPVSG